MKEGGHAMLRLVLGGSWEPSRTQVEAQNLRAMLLNFGDDAEPSHSFVGHHRTLAQFLLALWNAQLILIGVMKSLHDPL